MTIQDILKKFFVSVTGNEMDAETISKSRLFDMVMDKLPSDLSYEDAEDKTRIALTEVLFETFVK